MLFTKESQSNKQNTRNENKTVAMRNTTSIRMKNKKTQDKVTEGRAYMRNP